MSKVKFSLIAMAVLVLTVLFSSCLMIPSMKPFYTDEDVVFDENLLGKWGNEKPDQEDFTLIFRKRTDSSYTVESFSYNRIGVFEVHLFKLDDQHYLDFYPIMGENVNDFHALHFIPAHTIMQCRLEGDRLAVIAFNLREFEELLKSGELVEGLRYERFRYEEAEQDGIVLTSPTEELQSFILSHVDSLFPADEEGFLTRKQ
jgi:hypothetical protein